MLWKSKILKSKYSSLDLMHHLFARLNIKAGKDVFQSEEHGKSLVIRSQ